MAHSPIADGVNLRQRQNVYPFEDAFGLVFNIDLSGNETRRVKMFGELLSVNFTEIRDVILLTLSGLVLLKELRL